MELQPNVELRMIHLATHKFPKDQLYIHLFDLWCLSCVSGVIHMVHFTYVLRSPKNLLLNCKYFVRSALTHWGRVTHICITKLTIIGSDNGLSPGRHQAIIWTNAGILLIWPLGTNFSEILFAIYKFSFKKMHLKMSSGKWQPSCLGLNVLKKPVTYAFNSVADSPWVNYKLLSQVTRI